ncbi:hypothetical protein GW7_01501 [Heterocephalus glaber]|uniref:Uncharacterized protein n=1 Tax=Heterocephalus glaber TaxID=10181 RepID=G5BSM6_HETGA|nr:hypothetical protein GW7_01501 [Heterocephalus glaber]
MLRQERRLLSRSTCRSGVTECEPQASGCQSPHPGGRDCSDLADTASSGGRALQSAVAQQSDALSRTVSTAGRKLSPVPRRAVTVQRGPAALGKAPAPQARPSQVSRTLAVLDCAGLCCITEHKPAVQHNEQKPGLYRPGHGTDRDTEAPQTGWWEIGEILSAATRLKETQTVYIKAFYRFKVYGKKSKCKP